MVFCTADLDSCVPEIMTGKWSKRSIFGRSVKRLEFCMALISVICPWMYSLIVRRARSSESLAVSDLDLRIRLLEV